MPMPTRAAWRSVLWDVAATLSVPLGIKLAMESTEYQFFASGVNHMCVWCRWGSLGNSDCYANWTALWRDIRAAGPADDFAFFVGGTTVVHLGVFWTYCLALSVLDLWGPAWVVKYKVQEKHAATPLSPRKWWKGVRRVLFNNIVVTIPLTALAYGRFEGRLDMPLPSLSSALLQMTAFVFVEEILFYYSHRLLHHPRLYPHIHKIHQGERSYHAFYQLFQGAKEREAYGIGADPEAFATLTKGGCTTVDAIDDAQEWDDQRAALDILDFSKDDQRVALGVVAATLHLGLAAFSADGDGSRVSDAACLAKAAPLLGVDAGKLAAALTTRTEQMGRGSMVTIKLSPPAAKDAADALAKALYGRLFDWLVVKINASISRGEGACHVGVLDIFGFEVFKVNSFEQLCINYTNEKLQLFFNDVVFGEEMKMYESEGVPHTHMAFEDNAKCVALLDGKPVNLLSLLDDECSGGASAKDAKCGSKAINTFAQGPHKNAYFGGKDPSGRSFAVLKRADDLDLGDCEAVASARAEFEDIVKRAELVESLRRFVADPFGAQAPSGADLDVPKLLEEAARLGLASPDVDEARRRYEEVEPTLDARRELRHAVEGVHADGIDASLKRVLALLDGCDPAAAAAGRQWPELRAARAMRRMLKFDGRRRRRRCRPGSRPCGRGGT